MAHTTVSFRMDEDLKAVIESHSRETWDTMTGVIEKALEEYLRDRYAPDEGLLSYSGPEEFDKLSDDRKNEIIAYLKTRFEPSDSYNPTTSYALKHFRTEKAIGYLTNGEFKGAMLAAGFIPQYQKEEYWRFKVQEHRPPSLGIHKYIAKKSKTGSGYIKMFAEDLLGDRRGDSVSTVKDMVCFVYRLGMQVDHPMCREARSAYRRIIREYGDARPLDVAELIKWIQRHKLYPELKDCIPEAWHSCVNNRFGGAVPNPDILATIEQEIPYIGLYGAE